MCVFTDVSICWEMKGAPLNASERWSGPHWSPRSSQGPRHASCGAPPALGQRAWRPGGLLLHSVFLALASPVSSPPRSHAPHHGTRRFSHEWNTHAHNIHSIHMHQNTIIFPYLNSYNSLHRLRIIKDDEAKAGNLSSRASGVDSQLDHVSKGWINDVITRSGPGLSRIRWSRGRIDSTLGWQQWKSRSTASYEEEEERTEYILKQQEFLFQILSVECVGHYGNTI